MEKELCTINWGMDPQTDPPNEKEIKAAIKRINKEAAKKRVFSFHVTGALYHWLKENLKNAHVKLVMSGNAISSGTSTDHWIIVGADKYAAQKYYDAI